MSDESERPTPPARPQRQRPQWTSQPYPSDRPADLDKEPVSSITRPITGRTRRRTIKQSALALAILGLLGSLTNALVDRILHGGPLVVVVTALPEKDGGP